MNFIDTAPTLQNFYDDMDKRASTAYRMRGDHVIEVEFHRASPNPRVDSNNQGNINIWKAQTHNGQYVPGDGAQSQYKWYHVASGWQNFDKFVSDRADMIDHADEIAATLAESDMHFNDFTTNHAGGVVSPRTDIPNPS